MAEILRDAGVGPERLVGARGGVWAGIPLSIGEGSGNGLGPSPRKTLNFFTLGLNGVFW